MLKVLGGVMKLSEALALIAIACTSCATEPAPHPALAQLLLEVELDVSPLQPSDHPGTHGLTVTVDGTVTRTFGCWGGAPEIESVTRLPPSDIQKLRAVLSTPITTRQEFVPLDSHLLRIESHTSPRWAAECHLFSPQDCSGPFAELLLQLKPLLGPVHQARRPTRRCS